MVDRGQVILAKGQDDRCGTHGAPLPHNAFHASNDNIALDASVRVSLGQGTHDWSRTAFANESNILCNRHIAGKFVQGTTAELAKLLRLGAMLRTCH